MDVVESVPFGFVPHAFELRFNHLIDPTTQETYLQLIYKFGGDDEHYEEYEVLIRTYKVDSSEREVESTLQA
jgi:hypothetical protein